ncbi:PKD domain-containing protein [Mariniphaga sp.]|uniref:PKD domain-containing protein n=1 Tax=Mariniphaga sp. TaxID=1954475 RepID=UPI003568F4F6
MRNIYTYILLVALIFTFSKITIAQTHFTPVYGEITPPGFMNINLMEAKVNGVNLVAGDEIGVFDGDICVGVVVLTEELGEFDDLLTIAGQAGEDDAGTISKDGFTIGNSISYKFWDVSEEEEIAAVTSIYYNVSEGTVIDPAPVFQEGESVFVVLLGTHNYKPVADAGTDFSIDEKTAGQLNGSGSSDPESATLTFLWKDIDGFGLTDFTSENPAFTAPSVLADATYRFALTVNDGERDSEPDTVVVKVVDVPLPPTADAGTDFEVTEEEPGQLDGSASNDPEGLAITYSWEIQPPDFTLDDATSATPSFTAPTVTSDTEYLAILTVTNTVPLSSKDTVVVTIKDFNRKPVAVAGDDQQVDEGVTVTLDGSTSSDPDAGDIITFLWIAPDGITFDGDNTNPAVTFTSPVIIEDFKDYEFKLVVNDGKLDSDTAFVTVRVIHENIPPVADAGPDQTVDEGDVVQLDGTGSTDTELKPLTYLWTAPAGITLDDPTAATPLFTAPEVHENTDLVFTLTVDDGIWTSTPDDVIISVLHINKPPVADAGEDQTVDEGSVVLLDGTGSSDPDELDVLTYTWTSLDGAVLDDNTSAQPSFTAPEPPALMKDSTFRFELIINDGTVDSEPDTVSVFVVHTNIVPVADAGADFAINENEAGQLDGSGSSDPEGADLTYLWTAPTGFVIDDPTAESPTFTAPEVEEDTDFEITLTVDDGEAENNTASDVVIVTVNHINKPPVADAGTDFSIREQKTASLDGTASADPDALDNITFSWTAPAGIILDDATSATPSFSTPAVTVDTDYTFTLVVTDGSAETDIATVTVTVTENKAPVADAGETQKVYSDNLVTLDGTGSSDPDGDLVTYAWTAPAGITLTNPGTANPTFTAPKIDGQANYTFTLVVTDDLGLTDETTVDITVVGNLPPVIVTETMLEVREGQILTLDASDTYDPDGDELVFRWSTLYENEADLVQFSDSSAQVTTITVPEFDEYTVLKLKLQVNDGIERVMEIIELHIRENTAPVADAGADITVNEGEMFTLDGSASSDLEGDALSYIWSSDDLTIDNPTLEMAPLTAPEVTENMTYHAILVVNDGILSSEPDTVTITVLNINLAPVAVAGEDIVVTEGEEFTLNGKGSFDPDGEEITFTWSAGDIVLEDATLDSITVTAPEVHDDITVPVVLVVNDGEQDSEPDTVLVTVLHVNKAPEFDPVENVTADIGYGFSATVSATDPDALDDLTIFADDLPEWMTLTDNGDGTATLASDSIPRVESLLGEHTFTLKASDGVETVETSLTLNITVKVGINDIEFASLKVYPNPTNGLVNIQFETLPENGTKVQVFNQLGQNVLFKQVDGLTTQIDLSANPAGVYFIKVSSQNTNRTEKITLR